MRGIDDPTTRIVVAIAEIAALESAIVAEARRAADMAQPHAEASGLLEDIERLATGHQSALADRLRAVGTDGLGERRDPPALASSSVGLAEWRPISDALSRLGIALNQAVLACAIVQPLAHRLRDSWVVAEEGTTAHLARKRTQDYMAAVGRIFTMLPDVVRW